ncbi:MAG TPA: FAD-dependent thymidylate synthase [Tissierellaceae bacterium]|nr:FAD-dependent thymidylate synthase [Tissierellaceae bacterium]
MAKITLLHHTPIDSIVKATAMPYQSEESRGLVKRVWDSNHRSIARHGMASFLIEGVSQSLLRQISRHPHISLMVKSTRYCDMKDSFVYTPTEVSKMEKYNEYEEDMDKIMDIYAKWKGYEGDRKEVDVAKQFLPLASTTDLVLSGNYQGLYEFCSLRNCVRAEEEIRNLSLKLTEILKSLIPEIFGKLDCSGSELGVCPEARTCGKYPIREL